MLYIFIEIQACRNERIYKKKSKYKKMRIKNLNTISCKKGKKGIFFYLAIKKKF